MMFWLRLWMWRLFGWRKPITHVLLTDDPTFIVPSQVLWRSVDDEPQAVSDSDARTHAATPDIEWKLEPLRRSQWWRQKSASESPRRSGNVRALKSMSEAAKRAYDPPAPPPEPPARRNYYL